MRTIICSFSGSLGELPRGKRAVLNALRVLSDDPRVSCFERGPDWLENLIQDLTQQGLVIEQDGVAYPWCRFNLTDAGRKMLAEQQAGEGEK